MNRFFRIILGSKHQSQSHEDSRPMDTEQDNQEIGAKEFDSYKSDAKIITSLKSQKLDEALRKIKNLEINESNKSPKNNGGDFNFESTINSVNLSDAFNNLENATSFKVWIDQNLQRIKIDPKKTFEELDSYYSGSSMDEKKIEKMNYLLAKFADNVENIDSEKNLYFKIAKDNTSEGQSLAMSAFLKLATHRGLSDEEKYKEALDFLKQRTNTEEVKTFLNYYIQKNPRYGNLLQSALSEFRGAY